MNLTTLFIKRPVMTTLVMIAILFFGIVAYRQLPVSDLPNVDFPTITVTAMLPGASPADDGGDGGDAAREAVLDDRRHRQHDVHVEPGADADRHPVLARPEHRRRRAGRAGGHRADAARLPQGILPPSYQKTNPADAPILTLALTSDQVPLSQLDEYGETTIAQRLSTVSGVAQVLVFGAQKYAVRVQLDPSQLATRNLALEDVATAVSSQNVNLPTGVLWGPRPRSRCRRPASSSPPTSSAISSSPIATARRCISSDIGRVTDDVQNNKTASWYGASRSIVLAIQRQPGTNTVAVAERVKAALPRVEGDIPPSVNVSPCSTTAPSPSRSRCTT